MSRNVKKHVCVCGKEYAYRASLYKHKKLCSKSNSSNTHQKLNVCREADCEFRYLAVQEFRQHLTKEHGFVFTEEVKTFVSRVDFLKWKFNLQRKMKVFFQMGKKSISAEGSVEYLYCNRSGMGMNVSCTATMRATTLSDGTVNLCFWPTHYGHDAPLPHITIPTGAREDIAANHKERNSMNTCREADCDFRYLTMQEFRHHLSKAHGFALIEEEKTFVSKVDFQQWKYNFEMDTNSFFRKCKTNVTTGGTVDYFNCNRSGRYKTKSDGRRKSKSQGTCKINMNCTARMRAQTLSDGTVQLNFCSTHYGHDAQLCHIRIPKGDREDIAENLQEGIPAKKILKQILASEAQTLKRKHLVTKKDLNNIASAYGIDRTQSEAPSQVSASSLPDHVASPTGVGTASVSATLNIGKRSMEKPSDLLQLKKEFATAAQMFCKQVEMVSDDNVDLLLATEKHITATNAVFSRNAKTASKSTQTSPSRDIYGSTSCKSAKTALKKQKRLLATKNKLPGHVSKASSDEKPVLPQGLNYEERETYDHTYCVLLVESSSKNSKYETKRMKTSDDSTVESCTDCSASRSGPENNC